MDVGGHNELNSNLGIRCFSLESLRFHYTSNYGYVEAWALRRPRSGSVVIYFELRSSKATVTTDLWRKNPVHEHMQNMTANSDEAEDLILA